MIWVLRVGLPEETQPVLPGDELSPGARSCIWMQPLTWGQYPCPEAVGTIISQDNEQLHYLITPDTCVQLQALHLGDPGTQGPVLTCTLLADDHAQVDSGPVWAGGPTVCTVPVGPIGPDLLSHLVVRQGLGYCFLQSGRPALPSTPRLGCEAEAAMGREQVKAATLGLPDTAALQFNEADPDAQREGLLAFVQCQLSRAQGSKHLGLVSAQLQHACPQGSGWLGWSGVAWEALLLQAGLQRGAPHVPLSLTLCAEHKHPLARDNLELVVLAVQRKESDVLWQ